MDREAKKPIRKNKRKEKQVRKALIVLTVIE
jgi:hypothetical protein